MAERPDDWENAWAFGDAAFNHLARKAARYDWLVQGGIYRIDFDSTGGVSLEQWDSVIDEQMDREVGNGR